MPKQTPEEHRSDAERLNVQQVREKAGEAFERMKELRALDDDPKHTWTAENERAWQDANDQYNALSQRAERLARMDEIEQARNVPAPGGDGGSGWDDRGVPEPESRGGPNWGEIATRAWFRARSVGYQLTEREQEACNRTKLNPMATELRLDLGHTRDVRGMQSFYRTTHPSMAHEAHQRALSGVHGSSGATLRGADLVQAVERNMLSFSGMLQAGEIITTSHGNPMKWPTANDTGNEGRQIDENESNTTETDPTTGVKIWNAYEFSSDFIKVPMSLLQDVDFDLEGLVGDFCGERLGRVLERKATLGTGAGTFLGIMLAASLGKVCDADDAVTSDEIIDLEHSVDPAYRQGAEFMMHDSITAVIRKLKVDGTTGAYIWQPGLQDGAPDRLNGYMHRPNQLMESTLAIDNKVMLFGQLKKYKIRMVRQIVFRRVMERFIENNQEGFIAFVRADGNLLDAGTAPVKYMQMAAS